jgi:hypothetical protein
MRKLRKFSGGSDAAKIKPNFAGKLNDSARWVGLIHQLIVPQTCMEREDGCTITI